MFLVHVKESNCYIFTKLDPRKEGYEGEVAENIKLISRERVKGSAELAYSRGPQHIKSFCLGRNRQNAQEYHVFLSQTECEKAGCEWLGPNFLVFSSWSKFKP